MPAHAYPQYQDPKTGETYLMPQLFPHAKSIGSFTKAELEDWVLRGDIPRDLYESDLQAQAKMDEIRDRLKKGEQVLSSELPTQACLLTQYLLDNKARLYGENVLPEIFSKLDVKDPDIVWLSFVKEGLTSIVSKDPLPIHFHVARRTLKEKYGIEDTAAVDILVREFLEHCRKILKFPSINHPAFQKLVVEPNDCCDHLEAKEGLFQIDSDFVDHLKSIGSKGKKLSKTVKESCIGLYSHYKENNFSDECRVRTWSLWVNESKEAISPFMSYLAQVLWEDKCTHLWNRKATGHAALAKPVIESLIPILGPSKTKKFVEHENGITCYGQTGKPLFMAPTVDVNMISAFKKGVKELGTLTGHKMLRWQVNAGFERWQNGEKDPRLIEIDGGYSRIAEIIRCSSKTDIAKIKEILYAQAYGNFIFPDGSHGNMLSLRIEERYKNNEPSKIRIVLGDMLLPAYVCQLQRSEKRLIPIGPLPPLHGSPNSHASQAQLQLHVFSEFSNQSDRLAETGSVLISLEKWQQMAHESGLNPERIAEVINCWCQPDLFNCFLEKQGDEYRLASYYERAQKFLQVQGERRINNSARGKRSVELKRENSKKS